MLANKLLCVSESSLHRTCRLQFGSHHFLSFEGRCCFWINTASSATWLCPPCQEELSTLKGGQERIHNRHSLKANVPLWSDLYAWNLYYIIYFQKGHVLMYSLHVLELGMRESAGAQSLLLLDINHGRQSFFFLLLSVFGSVFVGLGKTLPSLVLDDKLLETLRQLSRAWITTRNTSARSLKLWLTRSIRISLRRRYTATLVSGLDRVFLFFWSFGRRRMFCQTVWIDIVVLFFPRRLLCRSNCFSFAVDFYIFG